MKLCLVVPTRNRPELAIRAARSVLTQPAPDLSVLVSDNSASAEDVRALEALCRDAGDQRLHYVRPAEELSMPAHWDWALERALSVTDATHFGIQYDRKLWKPGELALLRDLCAVDPDLLLTYPTDVAEPSGARFICGQMPGTGKVYEIACERVMDGAAFLTASDIPYFASKDGRAFGYSCAINGAVGLLILRAGRNRGSMTLLADGKHLLADAITSAAVIMALIRASNMPTARAAP